MRRGLLMLIFLASFSPALRGQGFEKSACYSERKENAPFKKKLWDGYEISLGPSRDPDAVEEKCTAAIYNSAGRVVFRTNGYSVVFDEKLTGEDFDGDGKPEVVFRSDTGGGMHCCWGYIIYSFSPKPHKLFEIAMEGKVDFKKDKEGKMVIWQKTAGPYGLTTMARVPFAEKVLRVKDGKLSDATPEFCGRIFSEENEDFRLDNNTLTRENLKKLQAGDNSNYETEDIVSALLSRALQHVFCQQYDEALKDLNQWPQATRAKMMEAFGNSIRQEYPEFAAKLQETLKSN
jgi:hypothetical protein